MIRAGLFEHPFRGSATFGGPRVHVANDGVAASEANKAIPLLGVAVTAEVVAGHAAATVRQRYRNDGTKPIEAIYTFPLPTRAVLTAFSMTVAGRELVGTVREREEAFREYDDAITRGDGAALLEQERPNVFTANVGNLLPGEETVIEIRYVEPVAVEEGAVRWAVPTLVAPRYIPGVPSGDRTAHGVVDPTDRVPDADRISPPTGAVAYGLSLEVSFDLGVEVDVECPSHAVVVRREGSVAKVSFAQREVPLDRDVVLVATARAGTRPEVPIAAALTHRPRSAAKDAVGSFALTIVPDLGAGQVKSPRVGSEVVFVLDRSGSMGGASMPQARTALQLCLRQLREGDRFNILAFDNVIESLSSSLLPFTQATLEKADAWLASIEARGGTELYGPMLEAARQAPDGIVVLLTDGEVGNEDEILKAFVAARKSARVYSFGIGTNVSDVLLQSLADRTGGAVETIYPGERIEEKVVAQFARATAPRVTDVTVKTRGIDLAEMAPAEPRALVDGEPWSIFGTYEQPGRGAVEIRGKLGGESFYLEVPVDLAEHADHPLVRTLWAQARIRDLERSIATLGTERRAAAMKERIVKLAVEAGVSSQFTSFVVVEKRTGDRRAKDQPETRVVPVSSPHGWSMPHAAKGGGGMARMRHTSVMARSTLTGGTTGMFPPSAPMMMPAMPLPGAAAAGMPPAAVARGASPTGGPPPPAAHRLASPAPAPVHYAAPPPPPSDPVVAILGRQTAAGLWEAAGKSAVDATVDALMALLRLDATAAHPIYGAQIKKAVEALLARLGSDAVAPGARDAAFGLAWLLASGRRTRQVVESAAKSAGATLVFGDERALRARVEQLATA
jgi:Ca-activated chloride channel family protein